jgi:hypothetical protein
MFLEFPFRTAAESVTAMSRGGWFQHSALIATEIAASRNSGF